MKKRALTVTISLFCIQHAVAIGNADFYEGYAFEAPDGTIQYIDRPILSPSETLLDADQARDIDPADNPDDFEFDFVSPEDGSGSGTSLDKDKQFPDITSSNTASSSVQYGGDELEHNVSDPPVEQHENYEILTAPQLQEMKAVPSDEDCRKIIRHRRRGRRRRHCNERRGLRGAA